MDAKATVKIGEFSRNGKNRVQVQAQDHDFQPDGTITMVGILSPESNDLSLYGVTSKVTSDCLVDILESWWDRVRLHFSQTKTLLIDLDNGPENHSRRTQFLNRMVQFVAKTGLAVRLAYYPPYHSKYNPIERCWGILEHHWNGDLLDSVDTVLSFAQTMTWKGKSPTVTLVSDIYKTGVKLSKDAMNELEKQVSRLPELGKWFVDIHPDKLTCGSIISF